jgi:hypothetical protein
MPKLRTLRTSPSRRKDPHLDHIPAQFRQYRSVFSEQASERLPQHQPWDHAIDLKPDTTMKKCSVYRLTTAEMDALKLYIEDHLQKDTSNAPNPLLPAPFSLSTRKTANYALSKTIAPSMISLSKTPRPCH